MKKYIRFEVIQNEFWSRPYLIGVYVKINYEKKIGKIDKDWLLSFGSKIKNNEAKIELERIAHIYTLDLGETYMAFGTENERIESVLTKEFPEIYGMAKI